MDPAGKIEIRGEVLGTRFANLENGFRVVNILSDHGEKITVCGTMPEMFPGQTAVFTGHFERHHEFGRQFSADGVSIELPATLAGLKSFLAHCASGIGPKNAEKIVDFFGADTIKVLDNSPERLTEIPGIGKKRAAELGRVWKENSARRNGMIFLQGLGISPAYCEKLFRRYGDEAPDVVRQDPYRLARDIDGIGFIRADELAKSLGIEPDSESRLSAAAHYVVNEMVQDGHVGVPQPEVVAQVARLAGVAPDVALSSGVRAALRRGGLKESMGLLYLPYMLAAEEELPFLVAELSEAKKFAGIKLAEIPPQCRLPLAPEQRKAVEMVSKRALSIITGGPGVGKTTVLAEIVARAAKAKLQIALCAPTGRAAKRLAEATKHEASTLHRLLGYDPAKGGFSFNRENPLPAQLVIVDEVSMLDIQLCHALFLALRSGVSLILVGDQDQLPSVGPGRVLRDFIDSGFFAVTRLTTIFRQSAGSHIISGAHAVNRGKLPDIPAPGAGLTDFYFIEKDDPLAAQETIGKLVVERIPERFGFDRVRDIQVLTLMNRGDCGTVSLNEYLGSKLNGGAMISGFKHGNSDFRRGDKVMQTANNYDKGVFNGDMGILCDIYNSKRRFFVRFEDGRTVEYSFDEAGQLVRAYAVTVHKSQGCEFPAVVLVLLKSHYLMLKRKLLYTAMTRAKKLLVIVGSRTALASAIANVRQEIRYTKLPERLKIAQKRTF